MSKHAAWLHKQLADWASDGLIDEPTRQTLAARYPETGQQLRGYSLLTSLGGIIFGLGIILFFAYNWAAMHKFVKLAIVGGALFAAHGAALALAGRQSERSNMTIGFHVVGTMMFGAGIWLIAQIYHIDEHYPTAFMVWGIGALCLAWAIPSIAQALIATVLLSVWGIAEATEFRSVHWQSISLIGLTLAPLAWVLRSRTLLLFSLLACLGLSLLNFGIHVDPAVVFNLIFVVSLLLIAAAYISEHTAFPESADLLRALGVAIYGCCLFAMTFATGPVFNEMTSLMVSESYPRIGSIVLWALMSITVLFWTAILIAGFRNKLLNKFSITKSLQQAFLLVSLLLLMAQVAGWFNNLLQPLTLLFNIILAAHSVLLIVRGIDNLKWPQVAVGCATLSLLVFIRFNDLFHSLLMRSLVFVVLGAMLFFIGHLYSKRKLKENAAAVANSPAELPLPQADNIGGHSNHA